MTDLLLRDVPERLMARVRALSSEGGEVDARTLVRAFAETDPPGEEALYGAANAAMGFDLPPAVKADPAARRFDEFRANAEAASRAAHERGDAEAWAEVDRVWPLWKGYL